MGRAVLGVVVLAIVAATGWLTYGSLAGGTPENTVRVQRATIAASVTATGKVVARQEARLGFKIPGRLKTVRVAEGDDVAEGQILAELEADDLDHALQQTEANRVLAELKLKQARAGARSQEIAAARAAVDAAQARLDELKAGSRVQQIAAAQATLDAARARLDQIQAGPRPATLAPLKAAIEKTEAAVQDAQADYDRFAWRNGLGASPQARRLQAATADYEAARTQYEDAARGATDAELRAAQAEVDAAAAHLADLVAGVRSETISAAGAELAAAQAKLDLLAAGPTAEEIAILEQQVELAKLAVDDARRRLADIRLVAPFAGRVLSPAPRPGEYAVPQQPIVTIGSAHDLEVKANVDEVDVGKIAVGQTVGLRLDAFAGLRIAGEVVWIAPGGALQQGSTVYPTTIRFSTPLPVRPGMAANVTIEALRRENVLVVPNRAIRSVGKRKVVEVLQGSRAAQREVDIGLAGDTVSEVVSGLEEGELVRLP
ncbi:MAG: efflux RND transporter periplasmic adaptor subunit [Chloroflexi bacterium]|nr:efflux RND transporter periplasmic adaptor subunit [Chloroflexota bacterium]